MESTRREGAKDYGLFEHEKRRSGRSKQENHHHHGESWRVDEDSVRQLAMASMVRQLQSKAAVATKLVAEEGSSLYKRVLEENKHYIQQEPTVQKCQELSKQLFYTRLARFQIRVSLLLLHLLPHLFDLHSSCVPDSGQSSLFFSFTFLSLLMINCQEC